MHFLLDGSQKVNNKDDRNDQTRSASSQGVLEELEFQFVTKKEREEGHMKDSFARVDRVQIEGQYSRKCDYRDINK